MRRYTVSLKQLLQCVFVKRKITWLISLIIASLVILIWTINTEYQSQNMVVDMVAKESNGIPSYIKYFDFGHFVDSNGHKNEKSSICVDAKIEVGTCFVMIFDL